MKKHFIPIILFMLLAQITFAQTSAIWNGSINTDWYTNNTSASEYTITTPQQLAGLAELVYHGYSFSGKTIKLGANIMLNNTSGWENWANSPPINSWTPIGTSTSGFRFAGTFDGNGFVISGIYINSTSDYQGLFGYIDGGSIKDIGVTASYIKGGGYVGALVGRGNNISNSYSTSTIQGTGNYVGGLTGSSSAISNSYFTGSVTGTSYVGGLVGSTSSTINNSYFNGYGNR